jgi:DNA-3-methyladenine glycosylase II
MTTPNFPYAIEDAVAHLSSMDSSMAALIHAVGPFEQDLRPASNPFEALSESITYQQLSGKAAGTIYGRYRDLLTDPDNPDPDEVLALPVETMRAAGLSGAKTAAIKDLAARTLDGTIPEAKDLHTLEDQEIIDRFTVVRGIGPWTVKMYLMFRLGRPDVLPHTDLGIRKGVQRLDGLGELPAPKEVIARAEPWQPYRTLASWYLWRCLELDDDRWLPAAG